MTNNLNSNPTELIAWFDDFGEDNEYSFLSNFYEGEPIVLPGVVWEDTDEPIKFPTGEHAFAAMKAWGTDWDDFYKILEAPGPGTAKSLGRSCKLRPDWEVVKLDVMAAVVRAKFTNDRKEGTLLCATGSALLIEGTHWRDDVWGVALTKKQSDPEKAWGSNWLGTLLMARRAELEAEWMYGRKSRAVEKNVLTAIEGWQKPGWM